jgi:hypothetical protein
MPIKPILFNTEMVRAILDGRKSCTRRINKDANDYVVPDMDFYDSDKRTYAVHNYSDKEHKDKLSIAERTCPICPGDILYVRESYSELSFGYVYKADGENIDHLGNVIKWHPSIHMPKEAARIWLKVTNVRVERLQQITEVGIRKEGIEVDPKECVGKFDFISELFFLFQRLWDSTIKKSDLDRYGWSANPLVWIIEFERCEKPEGV